MLELVPNLAKEVRIRCRFILRLHRQGWLRFVRVHGPGRVRTLLLLMVRGNLQSMRLHLLARLRSVRLRRVLRWCSLTLLIVGGNRQSMRLHLLPRLPSVRLQRLLRWHTLILLMLGLGRQRLRLHLPIRLLFLRLRRRPWQQGRSQMHSLRLHGLVWLRTLLFLLLARTADGAVGTVSAVQAVVIVTPAPLVVVSAVIVIHACVGNVSCAFPRSADANDRFVLQKVLPFGTQGIPSQPRRGHGLNNTGDACETRRA